MKKLAASILATGLVFGGISTAMMPVAAEAATTSNFKLIVEDKETSFEVAPIFVHNRAFVPLRAFSESLGATVDYNNTTKVATLTKDDIVLTLSFKSGVVMKNGTVIKMDEAPRFIHDRALVPLRFISQAFGNDVAYDEKTHTASVLATPKTLAKRATIIGVIDQVTAAMKSKTSFEMNLNLRVSASTSPTTPIKGTLMLDYTKNPLALYGKGLLKMPASAQGVTDWNLEMYLVDGKGYMKNLDTQKWESNILYTAEELNQFMQQSAQAATAELNVLLPYLSMTDNGSSYTITAMLDENGINKLESRDSPLSQVDPLSMIPDDTPTLAMMMISIGVDKATYLENSFSISHSMTVPDTKPVRLTISLDGTIGKYDSIPTIQIPDDVLKSATDTNTTTE